MRYFKVLDSSGLAFYHAPGELCKNFDGMILQFLSDLPELGQISLEQPSGGVVSLDYSHVQEVFTKELK